MSIMLTLPLACAALACASADPVEAGTKTQVSETPAAPSELGAPIQPKSVKLVDFDGAQDFLNTSRRLRIWRPAVHLNMKVNEQGEATDCEVVNRFRKNYVNLKLCEVAMAHYTFEPARNAQDEAVAGSYLAKLSYKELREEVD